MDLRFNMIFLLRITLLLYFLGVVSSLVNLYFRRERFASVAPAFVFLGFLVHLGAIVGTSWHWGELPLRSLGQTLSFLCWAAMLVYLLSYYRYRMEVLNVIIPPLVLLLMLISNLLPEGTLPVAEDLRNPLQQFHVIVAILGVSMLFITFATSLLYVIQDQGLKAKRPLPFILKLPPLEKCERIGYVSLTAGFVLLTLGLLTGAVSVSGFAGAQFSWRRESLAILSWGILAVILIARLARGWRGRKAAILTIIAFTAILFRMLRIL